MSSGRVCLTCSVHIRAHRNIYSLIRLEQRYGEPEHSRRVLTQDTTCPRGVQKAGSRISKMSLNKPSLVAVTVVTLSFAFVASGIFIDKGDPYKNGPLMVGQLTLSKTIQKAPLHTAVFFPVQAGDYPPIFFVGGLDGLVLAELYEDVQARIASHGFVVFGVDTHWPLLETDVNNPDSGADVSILFTHLTWLRGYMEGRTEANILWNSTVLMCHSAGCESTLKMIQQNSAVAQASVFLEPASKYANVNISTKIPILSYGTQLSEEGFPQCAIPGKDWRQFYKIFSCPKVLMEVKGFGHCDILDPAGWQVCHDTHFCKTTDNSRNNEYHQFVQGVISAFLVGTMEGYRDSLGYVVNRTRVPLELLDLQSDVGCL